MRHRFHALCPYFAMFPEAFVEEWISRLTKEGDVLLDPFCGRGTAPFQALLMKRQALAGDINPVAYCVTRAKLRAPSASVVKRRITVLENRYSEERKRFVAEAEALPSFFAYAYAPETLRELLFLREALRWRSSDVDTMVSALVLGALHGESHRSKRYLSNQMPRTISTKPAYSVRFWKQRGLTPPDRRVFRVLREQIPFRYKTPPPSLRGRAFLTDFRELPPLLGSDDVSLVVTSPPYLNVTSFEEDQWLRLWFLGHDPYPTYRKISRDDRHESEAAYWRLIGDVWRTVGRTVKKKGHFVIRIGGKGLPEDRIVSRLEATGSFSGRNVRLVSFESSRIKKRQTRSFRPNAVGCAEEVDCCFQVC